MQLPVFLSAQTLFKLHTLKHTYKKKKHSCLLIVSSVFLINHLSVICVNIFFFSFLFFGGGVEEFLFEIVFLDSFLFSLYIPSWLLLFFQFQLKHSFKFKFYLLSCFSFLFCSYLYLHLWAIFTLESIQSVRHNCILIFLFITK